ncbi:hypothetical protein [Bradyrhizobium sp. CCGUVB23]|uniref:hypothetical protein n=1 Tax=Bradyrhizobium sp. CCGUVB23 TaxID=2949630 RepID=UPI0020B3D15B|nr:hypothetical protein [Bradyrhizobium sp. CCGUVB23]MCP3460502.1 hypothetical protein [Bradyrhizobium sp. CCGUVB23]
MKPRIRATAAAVALAHSLQRLVIRVYEYEIDAHHISVLVREDRVSGYDYMSHSCVSGDLPNLYHQGEGSHFVLMPDGSGAYSGFDHDTSSCFSVKVTRREAHMFDCKEDSYFAYNV